MDGHFNSRTHVECDKIVELAAPNVQISTHALTWSATIHIFKYHVGIGNFNSRTHVECDQTLRIILLPSPHFNSRTHVECDVKSKNTRLRLENFNSRTHVECDTPKIKKSPAMPGISTHALTWSATTGIAPTTPAIKFQLTHSRGVRPAGSESRYTNKNFNSRTHVECDFFDFTHWNNAHTISTHALTWSATRTPLELLPKL